MGFLVLFFISELKHSEKCSVIPCPQRLCPSEMLKAGLVAAERRRLLWCPAEQPGLAGALLDVSIMLQRPLQVQAT